MDMRVSGRKVTVNDSLREYVEEKIGGALKVFDIQPMECDVVLRVDKNPSNPNRKYVEVTVFVRDNVVRVVTSNINIHAAIDEAADKVSRQLRKYKTKIIDRRQRAGKISRRNDKRAAVAAIDAENLTDLIVDTEDAEDEGDVLVREKFIELRPMTEEEALIQIDLLGHDFYMFENASTGLVNVMYRRNNGGYGVIKPKIEEMDD